MAERTNIFDQFEVGDAPIPTANQPPEEAEGGNPFDRFPTSPSGGQFYDIDFSAPVEEVRAKIAELPEAERRGALRAWAREYVRREREQGGTGYAVENRVRAAARGTPIGSYLDELQSGTNSLLFDYTGGMFGAPYDESQAYQRARDEAFDEANPYESLAFQLGGGIASAPFSPGLRLLGGASMGARIANSAATGGAYGLVYGSGLGDSLDERMFNSLEGAGYGFGLGFAAPVVGGALGNLYQGVARPRPESLRDFGRPAVERVARAVGDDGITSTQAARRATAPLGDEGMIADLGPNLKQQAGAIAASPGRGQTVLREALETRRLDAPGRIRADLDQTLGPRQNLPRLEQHLRRVYGDQAAPLYDEFYRTPIPTTPRIQSLLDRVQRAVPGSIGKARSLIAADFDAIDMPNFFADIAPDGTVTIKRMPSAIEWDYIKRAVDDIARSAERGSNEQRIFSEFSNRITANIDNAIKPPNGESPWKRARAIAGEGIGLRESMEEGQDAFRKSLSADQMAVDMQRRSDLERLGYVAGARAEIDEIMRNSGTKFGPNEDSAALRALGTESARDKIALMAGDDAAGRLVSRLEAEQAFERTRARVATNSETASRRLGSEEFPSGAAPAMPSGQATAVGRMEQVAAWIANKLAGGYITDRNARIAYDAARMLASQGRPRDQILDGIIQYRQGQQFTEEGAQAIDDLVNFLARSSRPAVIESQISTRAEALP